MAKLRNPRKTQPSIRRPLRLCIVGTDLLDDAKMTGNAAALTGIAQKFASTGDDVTFLCVPDPEWVDGEKQVEQQRQKLFEQSLINLVLLPPSKELLPDGGRGTQSIAVYHYLREQQFDAVFFSLEGGIAYYSLLAKETGVYANPPCLHVIAQSPTVWKAEADKYFLSSVPQVTCAYMEKYSAEACDVLICTSQTILNWMQSNGWNVSPKAEVISPLRPYEWQLPESETAKQVQKIRELVFCAGPEYHNGLTLLCDALDRVAGKTPTDLTVTMIGSFGQILGEHTGGMLLRRARNWPFEIKLLPRVNPRECLSYVRAKGALLIFPAYASATNLWISACIAEKLPFIGTTIGSIPEFLAPQRQADCLCDPTAASLAQKIIDTLTDGRPRIVPSQEWTRSGDAWASHIDAISASATPESRSNKNLKSGKLPLVSVVLVHHDRPQYLLQSVSSIEQQDYTNLELILVDDGSKRPESQSVLDALEPGFKKRGWRILRETNKYLGAARNAGVRAARGTHILFLDDDNALFVSAVSTLVRAMYSSGADICTCFRKTFYDENVPASEKSGYIEYIVLGGSLDIGFIENSFGDANALIRREVFDKIGYQVELSGRTGEDWEFFVRATLAGLKLRVVPEPLYWYRSNTHGMLRNSHWYDNRLPMLETFRKHDFKGLEHVYHLALSAHVRRSEIDGFHDNLRFSPWDSRFLLLCDLKPDSDDALDLLAAIAASEGRSETASALLAQVQRRDSSANAAAFLDTRSEVLAELSSNTRSETSRPLRARECSRGEIARARLSTNYPSELPLILFPPQGGLFLRPSSMGPVVAMLDGSFPSFARRVVGYVEIAHEEASPFEFAMALTRPDQLADWRSETPANCIEFSGWKRVEEKFQLHEIVLEKKQLARIPFVLNLAIRLPMGSNPSPANAFWRKLIFMWDE